jgi:hypothetical protein
VRTVLRILVSGSTWGSIRWLACPTDAKSPRRGSTARASLDGLTLPTTTSPYSLTILALCLCRKSLRPVEKLATAQRANKTPKRIRNIHVKIAAGQDQHGEAFSRPVGRASSTCCRIKRLRTAACVLKSTRPISERGALSGPKGIADLGIRDWSCSECGAVHRRDTNSARVTLRVGLHTLVGGTNG